MASLDNRGGKWEKLVLIFNCSDYTGKAQLPEGKWQILSDGDSSFLFEEMVTAEGKVQVKAFTAMILGSIA